MIRLQNSHILNINHLRASAIFIEIVPKKSYVIFYMIYFYEQILPPFVCVCYFGLVFEIGSYETELASYEVQASTKFAVHPAYAA